MAKMEAKKLDFIMKPLYGAYKTAKKGVDAINAVKSLQSMGDDAVQAGYSVGEKTKQLNEGADEAKPKVKGSFKKGGKVKKTGIYRLHKNEVVVPAKKAARMPALSGK